MAKQLVQWLRLSLQTNNYKCEIVAGDIRIYLSPIHFIITKHII